MAQLKLQLCNICNNLVDLRYRIQDQEAGEWKMGCSDCWQKVSQDNPYYRYGGTWKAKKKN